MPRYQGIELPVAPVVPVEDDGFGDFGDGDDDDFGDFGGFESATPVAQPAAPIDFMASGGSGLPVT